jgi:hypothetical protein
MIAQTGPRQYRRWSKDAAESAWLGMPKRAAPMTRLNVSSGRRSSSPAHQHRKDAFDTDPAKLPVRRFSAS